jgi:hypothetical protein
MILMYSLRLSSYTLCSSITLFRAFRFCKLLRPCIQPYEVVLIKGDWFKLSLYGLY